MGSALVSTSRDLPRVTRVASSVSLPGCGRTSEKPQATHRRSSDSKSTTIRSSALQLGHTAPAINRGLGVLLSLGDVIDNAAIRYWPGLTCGVRLTGTRHTKMIASCSYVSDPYEASELQGRR